MARDSLATLIKIRRLACDEAVRRLASALADEGSAQRSAHELERGIAREMTVASDPDGPDTVVEAFGAWLTRARRQLDSTREVLAECQAETIRVRAELTVCRTALETVLELQQQRRRVRQTAEDKAFQNELDDRATRPRALDEGRGLGGG